MNGKVVSAKKPQAGKTKVRTYFGQIAILTSHPQNNSQYLQIVIAPHSIQINGQPYSWKESQDLIGYGFQISIYKKQKIIATISDTIVFSVLRHISKIKNDHKVDYLGFYLKDGSGLSTHTHGLIGKCYGLPT